MKRFNSGMPVLTFAVIGVIFFSFVCVKRAEAQNPTPVLPIPPTGSTFNDNERMYIWNVVVVQNCLGKVPPPTCVQVKPNNAEYVIYQEKDNTIKPPVTKDFLLIPTLLMSGIESNKPEKNFYLPNYWLDAWLWAKYYLTNKKSDEWFGLAVNSANSRSEDQLHIHLCTVLPAVVTIIKSNLNSIKQDNWHSTPFLKLTHNNLYNAMQVKDLTVNPFQLVFTGPGSADRFIKADTNLLVIVRQLLGGFAYYILYNQDGRSVEELLNLNNCGV